MSNQNMNKQYAAMFKQRQAYMAQQANKYLQHHKPQKQRGNIQVRQGQTLQEHAAMMRQQEQAILAQKRRQQQQFGGMMGLQQQYSASLNNPGGNNQQNNGKQALAQKQQEMKQKEAAELQRRANKEKMRDNLNKDELILFYSNRCPHSQKIINILQQVGISSDFKLINVHQIQRNQLPNWLKTVPTLLNKTANEIYLDKNLFNWISNYINSNESKNSININGSEVIGNIASELGTSGCGAYYSFLDDVLDENKANNNTIIAVGNSMPSGFELLNTEERIVGFGNSAIGAENDVKQYQQGNQYSDNNLPAGLQSIQVSKPKRQQSTAQKSQFEQYMAMRNNDTNVLKQYQQQQYRRAGGY
jgi:hypothetical protein